MKVILLENIKGVGKKDEIINANDGYARNFLIPQKKAVEANNANMSNLKAKQDSNAFKKQEDKKKAEEIKEKLSRLNLKIQVKAGENGKIFGGVTAKEIAEQLEKQHKILIDKRKIDLKETIKNLGTTIVEIKLFESVVGTLKVSVEGLK